MLTTSEINLLKQQLQEKEIALSKFTSRGINIGLSRDEEAQEKKLMREVNDLKRQLNFQEDITKFEGKDKISMQTDLSKQQLKNQTYFQQLQELRQKNDQLNDKLN